MKFKLKERMAQNRQIAYTAIGVSLSILLLSFSYDDFCTNSFLFNSF